MSTSENTFSDDGDWLVSENQQSNEVIYSSPSRTLLFRSISDRSVLSQDVLNQVGPALPFDLAHADTSSSPVLTADVYVEGGKVWHNTSELREQLEQSTTPMYAFCCQSITDFLNAMQGMRISQPMIPILLYGHHLLIGPRLVAERSPCAKCWSERMLANLPSLAERVERAHSLCENPFISPAQAITIARTMWEARRPIVGRDQALSIDLVRGQFRWARLLVTPGCSCRFPVFLGEVNDLQSEVFGVVRSIETIEPAPGSGAVTATAVGHARYGSALGSATAFVRANAEVRALSEAAERVAAQHAVDLATLASASEVNLALSVEILPPFRQSQYEKDGFAYEALTQQRQTHWLNARSLHDGVEAQLPLRLVALDKRCAPPLFAPMTSTGIAAGGSLPDATERGLLELAERDVATRSWFEGKLEELDSTYIATATTENLDRADLSLRLFNCQTNLAVNVVIAFLTDVGSLEGAVGTAAGLTLSRAADHAAEEALQMLHLRKSRDQCFKLPKRLSDVPFQKVSPWSRTGDLRQLINHYRPWCADLSCGVTRGAGLHVVGLHSPYAVDFLKAGQPLPLRIWNPPVSVKRLICEEPSAFTLS